MCYTFSSIVKTFLVELPQLSELYIERVLGSFEVPLPQSPRWPALGLRDVLKVNIIGSSINGPCYQIPPWHHVFLLYCLLTQYKDLFINKTHTFFIFF